MTDRPAIIGVTRCSKLEDYLASVEQAGARTRVLEVTESPPTVLNEGRGPNGQIVPAAWLREATRPSHPEGPTGGYGLQWWTAANSEAFYALGLQGQYIYVDPPSRTVVVKMSFFPPADHVIVAPYASRLQLVPWSFNPTQWLPSPALFLRSTGAPPLLPTRTSTRPSLL